MRKTMSARRRSLTLMMILVLASFLRSMVVHAQPERISPLSDEAVELPRVGQMIGTIRHAIRGGTNESFGSEIYPLGDVNGDKLNDWLVARDRCDTITYTPDGRGYYPTELLLYTGRRGSLPQATSGTRIGPTEIGANTKFIASGDFDADGHADLVLAIWVYGDTTSRNTGGWRIRNLVVFWGNELGEYTLSDTSRLQCEADMWLGIRTGEAADFDGDAHVDLLIGNSTGFTSGNETPIPALRIFKGIPGARWGRKGFASTAAWVTWSVPEYSTTTPSFPPRLEVLDQDCDGANDIVFYLDKFPVSSRLTVLYGRPGGGWPDSLEREVIEPGVINGRSALFSDVTGDGTPDLLFNCGGHATVRIYAGRPGQRLEELYGSGRDESPGGAQWWAKPWAEIWTPEHLNDAWTLAGHTPPRKLGDASFDGRDEVWLFSYPYMLAYLTGPTMDSLADAWVRVPGEEMCAGARLGDIDGSGRITYAFGFDDIDFDVTDPFPGGIIYVATRPGLVRQTQWGAPRLMPHVDGEHCQGTSAVVRLEGRSISASRESVRIQGSYDAASGTIRLEWADGAIRDVRSVSIYSVDGRLLARQALSPTARGATIPLRSDVACTLVCTVDTGSGQITTLVLAL